ncbi:MAG: hypothetical protein K9J13_05130 [Saprospiraceae bacterium]|nr:hypothetical protein [Saprospiraceae bacterium]
MKRLFFLAFILVLVSFSTDSKKQKCKYEDENFKSYYELTQGRFNGNYVSYYKNGQKKSEGKFENNYRIGKWSIWDSTGRLRMKRDYENPFVFKRLIPKVPNDKPIKLLNIPQYKIEYNSDGCIDYFKLEERMVVWQKRVWRKVIPENNPILFENDRLFKMLNKNIVSKDIKTYDDDKWYDKELEFTESDLSSYRFKGLIINAEYFFDNERFVMEERIIGFSVIAADTINNEDVELYSVYFPAIREYLAQEKITSKGLPPKIKTLDDLFFYRCYYGQICKEQNVYDRNISDYKTGEDIAKEAEKIELNIIEMEHNTWIMFTKLKFFENIIFK